ncbi:MAG: cation:proton antiporter [Candidatus Omnitrophica bacterium]|nr:cation:proton antiporter [Candidatus Omnitrophota bacterium]
METIYIIASIWLGLAVFSAIVAYHLRVSVALVEIVVGIFAVAAINQWRGAGTFGSDLEWIRFLSSTGAILLTFLAGAELDPRVIRTKWKEVLVVGFVGFLAPFFGCAAFARFILHWDPHASWLAGVALSTTSMAVVYAVMLETGFNKTEFGKGILGSCFVNDLGTVIALGLLFAPFSYKTIVFVVATTVILGLFPWMTSLLHKIYGNRTAAIRAKWVMLVLFGLGALALWSGSEAVLPAYIAGMLLAEFATKEEHWVRRLRTLTIGFLTPFYFLRAGSLVSLGALASAPFVFLILLAGKVISKIFGLYPIVGLFRKDKREKWYYTLMMSTGLTFGTISSLYGLSHGIISKEQYSFLVATVIGSAVIPTLIANFAFLPAHLLDQKKKIGKMMAEGIDEE